MKKYFYFLCILIICAIAVLGVLIFQHESTKKDLARVVKKELAYSQQQGGPVTLVHKRTTYIYYPSDDNGKILGSLDEEIGHFAQSAKGGAYRFIGVQFSEPDTNGIRQASVYQHTYKKTSSSLKKAQTKVLSTILVSANYRPVKLTNFLSRTEDLKNSLQPQVEASLQGDNLSKKQQKKLLATYQKLDLSKVHFNYEKSQISFDIDGQKIAIALTSLYSIVNPQYLQKEDLANYQNYKHGDGQNEKMPGRIVALTFDDGPNSTTTPQVLKILAQYQAKATFFVVGQNISGNEQIMRDTIAAGHEIGNHSWSHAQLNKLPSGQVTSELDQTNQAITEATKKAPTTFRPPYGATNETVNSLTNLYPILWDVDTLDWKNRNTSAILEQVKSQVKDGSVILMHDIHQTTVDALPAVLEYLIAQGYSFVTVSQLYGYA